MTTDATINIDRKLATLTPLSSECCIFRVHDELRRGNEIAYKPEILSIGPYHRRTSVSLQSMDIQKLHYMKHLLQQKGETSSKKYVDAMQNLETKARRCYGDAIRLASSEFVEMLVLDGIFIVELFRKVFQSELHDPNDPIFNMTWICPVLDRDIWLFENQIPFFILLELFNMTKFQHQTQKDFISMALNFTIHTQSSHIDIDYVCEQDINFMHLLHLLHYCFLSSFQRSNPNHEIENYRLIYSVTDLRKAGIKFKMTERNTVDIRFNRGTLEIPRLIVDDTTNSFFRNLIAHEQYSLDIDSRIFSDYTNVMDTLLNSREDVEFLRKLGIIVNSVGDDKVIFDMFNRLGKGVVVGWGIYGKLFKNVDKYCSRPWKAKMPRIFC